MSPVDAILLLVAGIGAGALNAVVGAGTLITFPTLLALGVPPVVANVSNTVGLVPGAVTGAYGFRANLVGRWPLLRKLLVATTIGGVTGAVLLLALPAAAFEVIVPVLLVLAGILAAIQPRVAAAVARRRETRPPRAAGRVDRSLLLGVAATGVYGGYFGAAQGAVLLALLGVSLGGTMRDLNGIKNVLAGTANLVSAALFVVIADVDWTIVIVVAIGAGVGGGLGSRYGRRLPAGALRALVVAVAFTAAAWQVWGSV